MHGSIENAPISSDAVPVARSRFAAFICALILLVVTGGCAHYTVNRKLSEYNPREGYRAERLNEADLDDDVLILVTFSGGGTRAAAFSYGLLEAMRDTEVSVHSRKKRLLDEVDMISSVSGGSFTAASIWPTACSLSLIRKKSLTSTSWMEGWPTIWGSGRYSSE